ncbi:PH domain-containing protein [Streptomyces sp. NPDC008125]|uniref:PH domain-containing protein n=1 Tax=Streptomyces sp. NPDC008125 TaxID=3364811 RepID=UPI0036E44764
MVEPPQETWSHRHRPMGDIACAGGLDSVNLYARRVNRRIPGVSSPQRGVLAYVFESCGTYVPRGHPFHRTLVAYRGLEGTDRAISTSGASDRHCLSTRMRGDAVSWSPPGTPPTPGTKSARPEPGTLPRPGQERGSSRWQAVRMSDDPRLTYRSGFGRAWSLVGLGGAAPVTHADADGVRYRTPSRRRSVPWPDVVAVRVHRARVNSRHQEWRRVSLLLRDGGVRNLPQPRSYRTWDPAFDAGVEELRALCRMHGAPAEPDHLHVITTRTGGHRLFGPIAWSAPLLVVALIVALWAVPQALSDARAWPRAVPCTSATPVAELGECLATRPGVISRTGADRSKRHNFVYIEAGRDTGRIYVPYETARAYTPGDRVEVTFWRGRPRSFVGAHGSWHEYRAPAGQLLALAVALALGACYPVALAVQRVRTRRLPDDEVLPSALPFAGALVATALWLLPLVVLHPTDPLGSPVTTAWAVAGTAATVALLVLAFRAARVRSPGLLGTDGSVDADGAEGADGEEVFLSARFLEATEYNPYHFGTHVVLGGGEVLAVAPHSGPGRFGVKRVPVERLTVVRVRRVRGEDGDEVSGGWHVAELDDAGTSVRLAAAPGDLARILRALRHVPVPAGTGSRARRVSCREVGDAAGGRPAPINRVTDLRGQNTWPSR